MKSYVKLRVHSPPREASVSVDQHITAARSVSCTWQNHWGLGPLQQRKYQLFIPAGVSASRPAPLLVLHGCGQDAASFAVSTRRRWNRPQCRLRGAVAGAVIAGQRPALLNWFRSEARVAAETMLLMTIVEHICITQPVLRERVSALGISAGGTIALTLAVRFPEHVVAVGTHSGAVPHSAINAIQAAQAMHGRRAPDTQALRRWLAGRQLPPLIVLHGDADPVVAFTNARTSVALWLDLLPQEPTKPGRTRSVQRGARKPYSITDWKLATRIYVRLVSISGLGHAWSGGALKQAYSDAYGPDALRIALRFFSESAPIRRKKSSSCS